MGSFILKLYKVFQMVLCKWSWLVKPWSNFNLNFSFNFSVFFTLLQDSWKVTKIELVIVMIKSFDKYHYLFNLHILAKWLIVRLWTKWLWFRVQLQSLKLQILHLLWARVPWHSGNYRVRIHSEVHTWRGKNIQPPLTSAYSN